MSNEFLNGLKDKTNFTYTENGAITHKTTKSDLLDMFALGGAMRHRSDEDIILMFRKAYAENPTYAIKCLFYLRDILEGQGERRFFKVALKDFAMQNPEETHRILSYIPEFGRWDDLYTFVNTPVEKYAFQIMRFQLSLDLQSKTPSLLAKWLKSENSSSFETRKLGNLTRKYFLMSHKEYRQTLSKLRERINVIERLMSAGKWDEIEFDKIPSRAGLIYRNAFARHDLERAKSEKNVQTYADFAKDTSTTVNAKALAPYECVAEALKLCCCPYSYFRAPKDLPPMDDPVRLMTNKYWDNLTDYFKDAQFNALAVVDTSGSMVGSEASAPINVAISLGLYCAEKAKGPFANHYISFSSRPQLIETEGVDFVDKVNRIYKTNLVENTDIKKTFDLLLETARLNNCKQEDLPKNIIIISDMEFDYMTCQKTDETLMEAIAQEWSICGYEMPHIIYWNVDARQNNIPAIGNGRISYISGFSPSIFETIMSGKTGYELMMEKLDSPRYDCLG